MSEPTSSPDTPSPRFTPLVPARHGGKAWRRPGDYSFAATQAAVSLAGAELSRAACAMPIAFTKQGGRYVLAAVLSLTPGRNLFVAPDGRWLGAYVPACLASHPFRLLPREGSSGDWMLCVEEASNAVIDAGAADAQPFFDAEGQLAPATKAMFDFLAGIERNRMATDAAVAALAEAGVIGPWQITLKMDDREQAVAGLHRVDEAALNKLGDEAFLKVRRSSGLPIAYAQLLSTDRLRVLEQLAKIQAELRRQAQSAELVAALPESLDELFAPTSDEIVHFD